MKTAIAITLALFPAAAVVAQEPVTESAEQEPRWKGDVGLSYLSTTGNTDTTSFGLDLKATRIPDPWGLELSALFHRADRDGEKTAERYFAGLRGTRLMKERWKLFAGASFEKDEFAEIDVRAIVEAGGVYAVLLGPVHRLDFDLGLTWTDEDRLPPEIDDSWLGGLAGLGYEWKPNETTAVSQRLAYRPNFDDSSDWRLDSLTALTAALNARLALRLSYEVRYRNRPLDDNEDTDTTTRVSVVWKL